MIVNVQRCCVCCVCARIVALRGVDKITVDFTVTFTPTSAEWGSYVTSPSRWGLLRNIPTRVGLGDVT